ncbi:MAG: TetR/AcrR family transcriptional regulator [Hyphomicrobiaceae bacterium]
MTDQPATRPPGRPRSEATRIAILDTASNLLETESYSRISIERIAAEAKVGKQSIYRWWDSKADVLLEAYTERALKRLPPVRRGADSFHNLETLLRSFFANARLPTVGKTIRSLIAEAQHDADFRLKFHDVFVATRRQMIREALQAGVAAGQFRTDLDVETTIDLIYGAFWHRLLSGNPEMIDDAFAASIVAALRSGMASRAQ